MLKLPLLLYYGIEGKISTRAVHLLICHLLCIIYIQRLLFGGDILPSVLP